MTIQKIGTVWSITQYMEMMYRVSSSIERRIYSDGTNSEMCNDILCIYGMGTCYYAMYVYKIMITRQYRKQ